MSLEPRGYAQKLGNRYEGRWVALQLLHLLNEDIRSVIIEAIGDDEEGVDLWIERDDGIRQAQQCKVENSSKADWSMSDLNYRGILKSLKLHLERDTDYEFALVSGTPANMLRDLSRSARDSNDNPDVFYQAQIVEISTPKKDAFEKFCDFLGLDLNKQADLARAFDFLRRTHFHPFSDDQHTRDNLNTWASMLVFGEPLSVVAALCQYVEDNIRKTIYADDLRHYLVKLGFQLRELSYDQRLAPAIDELVTQFDESIAPTLISGELILRDEANKISDAINSDDFSGLTILHGPAGQGKSGILFQLVKMLREQEIIVLPIRLDRKVPSNNTAQFGKDIGIPESPVKCLLALAGERQAVLILDQLDALRWTSSHSSNALDVCRTLIREAITMRASGRQIAVVLSCRTFDLENDPGIKALLPDKQNKCLKVEVGAFSDETIKNVVESQGVNYSQLTERQKSLLSIAQNLAMWLTIKLSEPKNEIGFENSTELMRRFWQNRYRELEKEGLSHGDIEESVMKLVNYLESKGQLWAPESLMRGHSKISALFHSLGIIQTSNHRITFCHQSYLDFQIADGVLRQIHEGVGTVRQWLGGKEKQSLFRREQLRQVLTLLVDEEPQEFERTVHQLLDDPEIRFHLKYLVLSVIGQIRQPWSSLLDYIAEIVQSPEWHEHALSLIYFRHPQYVQPMIEKEIIQEWLNSSDEKKINSALWLLQSVSHSCGDLVADILKPLICNDGEWPRWVLNTLSFNADEDSDKMFELRLDLARMGQISEYIEWPGLVKKDSLRAIQLLEAIISTWTSDSYKHFENPRSKPHYERWHADEVKAFQRAATDFPELLWDMLAPHVDRLTVFQDDDEQYYLEEWCEPRLGYGFRDGMEQNLVEILCIAGKILASTHSTGFFSKTQELRESNSPIIQSILVECYVELPASYSDEVIRWLMGDIRRLSIGSGNAEPKWMPAVRLINKLSPHCSHDCFCQLEDILVHYHSENEKEWAKSCVKAARNGDYRIWFGEAQYFLIPALDLGRRSDQTKNMIRTLERKFSRYKESDFLRFSHMSGGTVVSPIKNPYLLSDKAWLDIIGNSDIPEEHSWGKQIDSNHIAESSIRQFSNSLRVAASGYPERFAQLAGKFPDNFHPNYLAAMLDGLKVTEPNKNILEEERAIWTPASTKSIEAIFKRFRIGHDRSTASTFCRLLLERPEDDWSNTTIQILLEHAKNHPDPEPTNLNVFPTESGNEIKNASVHTLETNSLNCVRGEAARAICALLWEHRDWFETLLPGLKSLVSDPHPAVRMAAVQACLPVININKNLAVELLVIACKDDLRVAACRSAGHFFNYTIKSHFDQVAPLIYKMLDSNIQEVVEEGATEVCARWIFYGLFEQELLSCCEGGVSHRKGIARIAAHFLGNATYSKKCRKLLLRVFDDLDADVRAEARKAFNDREALRLSDMPDFVLHYISSPAFTDDPTNLLYAIDEYPGSLLPYAEVILGICETLSGPLAEQSRSIATGLAHDVLRFSRLILRLYEQSQGVPEVQDKCLDAWDMMFENRVGRTHELMKEIDL